MARKMTSDEYKVTYIKGFTSYTDYLKSEQVIDYMEENGIELPGRCIEVRNSDRIKIVDASLVEEENRKKDEEDRKKAVRRTNGIAIVTMILGLLSIASILVLCFVKENCITGKDFLEKALNMLSGNCGIMDLVAIIFAIIAIIVIVADIIILIVVNKSVKEKKGA